MVAWLSGDSGCIHYFCDTWRSSHQTIKIRKIRFIFLIQIAAIISPRTLPDTPEGSVPVAHPGVDSYHRIILLLKIGIFVNEQHWTYELTETRVIRFPASYTVKTLCRTTVY